MSSEDREKQSVALRSLLAAVGLTAIKLVVGLTTGSLGILAEAAHSGLDPSLGRNDVGGSADFLASAGSRTHLYGHGKLENLSAFFETLLLVVTCAWVVWKAAHRLAEHRVDVQVTGWSFAVMLTCRSTVDFSRSRVLARTAKVPQPERWRRMRCTSRPTCGFGGGDLRTAGGEGGGLRPSARWLRHGDAVATRWEFRCWWRLLAPNWAERSIDALMDHAQRHGRARGGVGDRGAGVLDCHNLRIRYSGPRLFIDLHVLVNGEQSLTQAHRLTDTVEAAIQEMAPGADVTVHPEPYGT